MFSAEKNTQLRKNYIEILCTQQIQHKALIWKVIFEIHTVMASLVFLAWAYVFSYLWWRHNNSFGLPLKMCGKGKPFRNWNIICSCIFMLYFQNPGFQHSSSNILALCLLHWVHILHVSYVTCFIALMCWSIFGAKKEVIKYFS